MPQVPSYKKPEMKRISMDSNETSLVKEFTGNKLKIIELKNRNKMLRKLLKRKELVDSGYYNKSIKLYALRLEDDCWYIGQAREPERRFRKHNAGAGALWTRKHRPIEIYEVRDTDLSNEKEVALLEDKMTIEYAMNYGTQHVRGGGYCQVETPGWPSDMRIPQPR